MNKLNYWDKAYPLNYNECPCDVDFVDWINLNGITDSRVFHFGTGLHHYVGLNTLNSVFGITASIQEYEEYMKLSISNPRVSKTYKAMFGDIYQLDKSLLPEFDVISLFHLCEFWKPGELSDLELLNMLTSRLTPNGYILFYKGSNGYRKTTELIELWKTNTMKVHEFKSLLVYQIIG